PQRADTLPDFTIPHCPVRTNPANRLVHAPLLGEVSLAYFASSAYLTERDMTSIVVSLRQRPPQELPGPLPGLSAFLAVEDPLASGSHDDLQRISGRADRAATSRLARHAARRGSARGRSPGGRRAGRRPRSAARRRRRSRPPRADRAPRGSPRPPGSG